MDPQAEIGPNELALALYRFSGAGCVLVTLGEQGVAGADAQGVWRIAPPQVKVVDTSGAGDVFCAALAVGLTNGAPVRVASDWACQVAALSVTRLGTIPSFPTMDEVRVFTGEVKWHG
jgi:ribokinase